MKKLLILLFAASALMTSCLSQTKKEGSAETTKKATESVQVEDTVDGTVKVLSFHTNKRCVTCKAIEERTREAVAEMNNDKVILSVINISDSQNEAMADKYEVTWSSLVLDNGKSVNNLTQMAFGSARTNPDLFKEQLKAEIAKALQ